MRNEQIIKTKGGKLIVSWGNFPLLYFWFEERFNLKDHLFLDEVSIEFNIQDTIPDLLEQAIQITKSHIFYYPDSNSLHSLCQRGLYYNFLMWGDDLISTCKEILLDEDLKNQSTLIFTNKF